MEKDIYSFSVKSMDQKMCSLAEYRGKVLLIVNVASKCGFTSQYEGLERLHKKFSSRGFSVLGFPCNQFGQQEPGDEEEIKNFCKLTYDISFPIFSKIDVNGKNTDPLYEFLKRESKGFLGTAFIKWNFTKFLISRDGQVLERFAPTEKPEDLEGKILSLL